MNMKFYLKISSILVAAAFLSTLPVEAQTFRQTKQGITGTTQGMDIEIQFVSPEIVRVVKAPEGRSFTKIMVLSLLRSMMRGIRLLVCVKLFCWIRMRLSMV